MDSQHDIKPISYVRNNSANVLEQINNTHRPFYITQNGEVKGILIDPISYKETQDALNILRIVAQADKNFENNEYLAQDQFFNDFEEKNFGK